MKIICKIWEHRWNYYKMNDKVGKQIRSCKNCGKIQEYKYLAIFGYTWVDAVQYTNEYARKLLAKLPA